MFFFQGENTNKKTLQRLLAFKYATQDMDCPFHPKIVHCFPIASPSEHWEPREIEATRYLCHKSQPPGNAGRLAGEGSPWRSYRSQCLISSRQMSHGSIYEDTCSTSARHLRPRGWMLLHASPSQCVFQDPVLSGLLPFAVLMSICVQRILWKQRPGLIQGWKCLCKEGLLFQWMLMYILPCQHSLVYLLREGTTVTPSRCAVAWHHELQPG